MSGLRAGGGKRHGDERSRKRRDMSRQVAHEWLRAACRCSAMYPRSQDYQSNGHVQKRHHDLSPSVSNLNDPRTYLFLLILIQFFQQLVGQP